ncbi:hypothetical protein [Streptococcus intermedius]
MGVSKINVTVKIANADEFRSLVEKFNQKARELNEVAHELELFHFEGEIESKVIPKEKESIAVTIDSSKVATPLPDEEVDRMKRRLSGLQIDK